MLRHGIAATLVIATAGWAAAETRPIGRWVTTVAPTAIALGIAGREPFWPVSVVRLPPTMQTALTQRDAARRRSTGAPMERGHHLNGLASYYWQEQMTANGERFDRNGLTAAHRTLPFGTRVKVTNTVNGRTVVVRINDRGPFKPGRIIDLSKAAAAEIDMERVGIVPVTLEVLR